MQLYCVARLYSCWRRRARCSWTGCATKMEHAILQLWWKRACRLCRLWSRLGAFNDVAVQPPPQTPWEQLIQSLTLEEETNAWLKIDKIKERSDAHGYVLTLVNYLTDADVLSLRLDPPAQHCIWPVSVAQLVYCHLPSVTERVLEATVRLAQPTMRIAKELMPLVDVASPFCSQFPDWNFPARFDAWCCSMSQKHYILCARTGHLSTVSVQ